MHRILIVLGLFVALGLVTLETMGQCNFTMNNCYPKLGKRKCYRVGTLTGPAACTAKTPIAPATSVYTVTTSSTFIQVTCFGPLSVTSGNCSFTGCGVCGNFKVDMMNGMPVELMDFSVEDGSEEETEHENASFEVRRPKPAIRSPR